jgi:hypothetical protein
MKKIFVLSAILLGAVSASQAGIRLNIGLPLPPLPLPPLPGITIGRSAPPAYYGAPAPYCYDDPYYSAPVVVAPPPLYFGYGPRSYGYYGGDRHYYDYRGGDRRYSYRGGDHRDWDRRGGHDDGHHRR